MEGGGLLGQLGINWKLLISQAVNFFILLIVLSYFVYKPLLEVIKKRRAKIEMGLQKAAEADVRLKEIDVISKNTLKKADQESIQIIKATEQKAEQLKQLLQKKAEDHQQQLLAQAQAAYERQQEETKKLVYGQALELVKKTLIKTVQLNPKHVDDALIEKAVESIKHET